MELQVEELRLPVVAPAIHASAELPGMMVGTADQAEGHGYFSSREREESGLLIPDFEPIPDSQASRISCTGNTEVPSAVNHEDLKNQGTNKLTSDLERKATRGWPFSKRVTFVLIAAILLLGAVIGLAVGLSGNPQGQLSITATLAGHSDSVNSVAFSPDGATVASGSGDTTVRLWDGASFALTATLEGHWEGVSSVAFSPDGTTVASGSYDTTVRLWDAASGALTATLEGHLSPVFSVAFSPDGATVASGSWDKTVRLWDVGMSGV